MQKKLTRLEDLYELAKAGKKARVSVAVAQDAHVLEAVGAAHRRGLADFVLVGDGEKISLCADEAGVDISPFSLHHEPDDALACRSAVSYVAKGDADALMKGLVDTSVIMRAVLSKEEGMRTGGMLSHVAVFQCKTYHKLLFVTDAAINIAPDMEGKISIIGNALGAVKNLGIEMPKIALLAAKEKADPKMPVTVEIEAIVEKHRNGLFPDAILGGPFALDNAVSRESAEIKGITSPIAGDADILVAPNIEAANILYKSLAFLGDAKNGGVVVGAKRPVILTSRADSAESKLISIALGVLF